MRLLTEAAGQVLTRNTGRPTVAGYSPATSSVESYGRRRGVSARSMPMAILAENQPESAWSCTRRTSLTSTS